MNPANEKSSILKSIAPFAIGGISGMTATLAIHPLDTFKVQMQVISEQYGKANQKQKVSIMKIVKQIQN